MRTIATAILVTLLSTPAFAQKPPKVDSPASAGQGSTFDDKQSSPGATGVMEGKPEGPETSPQDPKERPKAPGDTAASPGAAGTSPDRNASSPTPK